jgi:phosphate transport system substrate-binding protein
MLGLGCKQNNENTIELSYPTEGKAAIAVDNSIQSLGDHLKFVFTNTYPKTSIQASYLDEYEMMKRLLNDSFNMVITTRKLNETELDYYKKINLRPIHEHFASDAVAIVTASKYDTVMTSAVLNDALLNATKNWNSIVFNKQSKSILTWILKENIKQNQLPKHYYGLDSIALITEYLQKNETAFALLPISDYDKNKTLFTQNNCKLIGIKTLINNKEILAYPYQSYIADSTYPLVRKLYTVTVEGRSGLGTGFASFIASDIGQRVVLRDGYLPATMPQRELNIKYGY